MNFEHTINYQMRVLRGRFLESLKDVFAHTGITYDNYITLILIEKYPGRTQAELADLNHKDRNVIGQTLNKLEDKGFAKRCKIPSDKRAYALYITEAGTAFIESLRPQILDADRQLLSSFTDDEAALFLKLLEKACVGGESDVK
ncbi:MarR family transcriptional regulator [Peptoniphilus equinus]|uniref:MarR family transcriptional regulator n=1 Tax=Peptoniphilus equinus TaxID=3016343 RepID=A0ABY7QTW7_9FIRM|nr:MarR family transcriptional regulator [Peptoniphilus equinus]WBW50225.1 MarR family transcriptional regulator [Peptoniphilus equinus]